MQYGAESLVVEFDDLEFLVEFEFEAIAELDAVAAAVTIDFGDGSAWELGVDTGCYLGGNEIGGYLASLAFDILPVAFLVELYLFAALVHHLVVVAVGGDGEGCLVGEVLLEHGLSGGGQTVEGDHPVVVGIEVEWKTDCKNECKNEDN